MDAILTYFMSLEYTVLYGLVAVNVSIATQAIERFSWWKAAIVGIAVFAWPMALVASVVRRPSDSPLPTREGLGVRSHYIAPA